MNKLKYDINDLSENQLTELHAFLTNRLEVLRDTKTAAAARTLIIGDKIEFKLPGPEGHQEIIKGTLLKINTKTVTILSNDGSRWRVSPLLLKVTVHE